MARSPTETLDLPVLPLRDVVVFPHMVIPLFVGRDKSMHALEQAMAADKRILLLAQKSAETDDPTAADLYQVGTLAQVLQLLKLPDGTIKVLVEGLSRVNVTQVTERDGALQGIATEIESDESREPREIEAIARSLMSLFEQYVKTNRKLPPELLQTLAGIDEPARLADTIAAHISVRLADKQRLLETLQIGDRLEMLVGLVDGEIDVQQMEKRIRGRVKSQMEKSQREYYLNEQMKAIQKELGDLDDAPGELDELARKIAEAGMPKPVETKAKASSISSSRCRRCPLKRRSCATTWTGCWACRGRSAPRCARTSRPRRTRWMPITSAWTRSRTASWNTWRCSRA